MASLPTFMQTPFSMLIAPIAHNNSYDPALAYSFEFSEPGRITLSFSRDAKFWLFLQRSDEYRYPIRRMKYGSDYYESGK